LPPAARRGSVGLTKRFGEERSVTDAAVLPAEDFDPWTAIPPEEFRERQRAARGAAAAAGFDAAVVWSRGGAFMDMSADVLYLANHYSQQPYMGD
jgi:hypothetical protein